MLRTLALASVALLGAGLARFVLARPAIEVRFARSAPVTSVRRDLASFREGAIVRASSAFWAPRHHPGYAVDGEARPAELEKWASAPGDRAPFLEVQFDGPRDVDEVALTLAGAVEGAGRNERDFRIACFAGERTLRDLTVTGNAESLVRRPLDCPGADRVRVTFTPRDLARVYELEVMGR